jgi:hypothetical protein
MAEFDRPELTFLAFGEIDRDDAEIIKLGDELSAG